MTETLCNLPTATVRLAGIASAQLMEGYVTEYDFSPGELNKHPLRLLVTSVKSSCTGMGFNDSQFPSLNYYGDDIYSALDALFESGYLNNQQHANLLTRTTDTVKKYNQDIAEFEAKMTDESATELAEA